MAELIKKFWAVFSSRKKGKYVPSLLSHGMTHLWKKKNIILLCLSQSVYSRNRKESAVICNACTVLNSLIHWGCVASGGYHFCEKLL